MRSCSRSRTSPAASTRPTGSTTTHLRTWVDEHGSLAEYPDVEHVSNSELLELPCDILVLAALEEQLTAENAPRIQCRLVAEGANGPTTIEADEILAERGIPVLPDVLTNAGGVTVSYFEWVQDLGRLFWDREEIRARLADKLSDAFDRVWDLAEQQRPLAAERGAGRRDPRGRRGARLSGDLPVSKVREAMVAGAADARRCRRRRPRRESCSRGPRCARSSSATTAGCWES